MNKKKEVIFLIVFILNSIYVLADEEIHNKWHYSEESFIANQINFTLLGVTDSQIDIKFNGKELFINNGTCKESELLEICVNNIKLGYYNGTTEKYFYQAEIKINQITSELELSRTLEPNSFLIGEESEIEVVIKNIGSRTAEDVVYEDKFPLTVDIDNGFGCRTRDHTIFWEGSLQSEESKTCSYKITANAKTDYKSKAKLTYNNGFEIKELSSNEVTITVPDNSLKITTSYKRVEIGETINFKIKLENINEDNDISIKLLKLKIPKIMEIIEKPINFIKKSDSLRWYGDLEKNKTQEFTFILKSERSGTYTIEQEVIFVINKIRKNLYNKDDLIVLVLDPYIFVSLEDSYLPQQKGNFTLEIENPSKKYKFDNIKIKIEGFLNLEQQLGNLNKGAKLTMFDAEFTAPNTTGTYPIQITMTYATIYNEVLKLKKTANIEVKTETLKDVEKDTGKTEESNETVKEELKPGEDIKEETPAKIELKPGEVIEKTYLNQTPVWVIIIIILFLVIDFFLAISIYRKKKKEKEE